MTFMECMVFNLGQIVISRKGKDSGTWYVVIGIDEAEDRVIVADGIKRTLAHPKPKNPKHLQVVNRCFEEIPEIIGIEHKKRFQDPDIRSMIERARICDQNKEVD